ncbi:Os05g0456800, partial [Oryza sativa Japonica Group]
RIPFPSYAPDRGFDADAALPPGRRPHRAAAGRAEAGRGGPAQAQRPRPLRVLRDSVQPPQQALKHGAKAYYDGPA